MEALEPFRDTIAPNRWSLIGASAIRCRLPLPRLTADIDFAVAVPDDDVRTRLTAAGWRHDSRKLQRWTRGAARVDVVSATEDDVLAGVVVLDDGFSLSVVGLDLAYSAVEHPHERPQSADRTRYGSTFKITICDLERATC